MRLNDALLKLQGLMLNARRTHEGMDEAQMHLSLGVPPDDVKGWQATFETLEKFGQFASACHVMQDLGVQVFIRWNDDAVGNEAVRFWNRRIAEIEPAREDEE
jgi:hypothetical protein